MKPRLYSNSYFYASSLTLSISQEEGDRKSSMGYDSRLASLSNVAKSIASTMQGLSLVAEAFP